jgi:ribosomal protein L37AE/L43A
MDCTTISAKSIRRIYIKTQIKKKSMEEIQKEFVCPKCESNEHLAFGAESATCTKCNSSYDLGLKKFQ